jgi:hypothetical protein
MKKEAITIAGERLVDLEAAFDCLEIVFLDCGCLGLSGEIPGHLSQSLERALKTLDAELSEQEDEGSLADEERDSVRQLLIRIGVARNEGG